MLVSPKTLHLSLHYLIRQTFKMQAYKDSVQDSSMPNLQHHLLHSATALSPSGSLQGPQLRPIR